MGQVNEVAEIAYISEASIVEKSRLHSLSPDVGSANCQ
jgi:hypothetical protein